MLPNEYIVETETADKGTVSFFISREWLQFEEKEWPVDGWVKVTVLETNDDYDLIYLPVSPIEDIGRTVRVTSASITATA